MNITDVVYMITKTDISRDMYNSNEYKMVTM